MHKEVWGHCSRVSREVLFTRRSVMDGMRWAGTKVLCRMSWSQAEHDDGIVEHCPHCWDPILKQVMNTRCPHCHGTGYADAYAEPFVMWCSLMENSSMDEKHEKAGYRDEQNMQIKLPAEPIFKDGDLFAEIREEHCGKVTQIGRVFMLDGPVDRQTVQGWVSNDDFDGERRSRVEDIIISQRGTVKLLLPSDSVYQAEADFWLGEGGCFCCEEADGPYSEIPQGDMPTIDVDGHYPGFAQPYDWWR